MRNLGGAIGIAGCATILNDRANLHFLRLSEHLTAANHSMQEAIHHLGAHFASSAGGDFVHGQSAAIKKLWSLTWREAQVQTYSDAFAVIAGCLLIATIAVPLMRKVAAPLTPIADGH
jgi:DHA2 family multidrug resistance protein